MFPDENGRMNRSVQEAGGALLVVSQFTLMGDARKGRRPAFDAAEAPGRARELYDALVVELQGIRRDRGDRCVPGGHAGRTGQRRAGDGAARQPPHVLK